MIKHRPDRLRIAKLTEEFPLTMMCTHWQDLNRFWQHGASAMIVSAAA
jgi:hypothetical protein